MYLPLALPDLHGGTSTALEREACQSLWLLGESFVPKPVVASAVGALFTYSLVVLDGITSQILHGKSQ